MVWFDFDADGLRAGKLGQIINDKLQNDPKTQTQIQGLQTTLGLKFPDDLHDVTLYGRRLYARG